ncbi:hypothetical protein HaLaN_09766 [Haematococcus lacustris]|uniref:Uncharacterized protein n=1 Tax=Haematococcus lacustris TaxID=44745 RepID=A0A699YX60_HAELA|nr:hypothetical protein HaLaN_09766 [Haematococcus lacustris]
MGLCLGNSFWLVQCPLIPAAAAVQPGSLTRNMSARWIHVLAGISGASAVALGAYGAHGFPASTDAYFLERVSITCPGFQAGQPLPPHSLRLAGSSPIGGSAHGRPDPDCCVAGPRALSPA